MADAQQEARAADVCDTLIVDDDEYSRNNNQVSLFFFKKKKKSFYKYVHLFSAKQ